MADKTSSQRPHQNSGTVVDTNNTSAVKICRAGDENILTDIPKKDANDVDTGGDIAAEGGELVVDDDVLSGAEQATVPLELYESLVSKIRELEHNLKRVDKVVNKELIAPWADLDRDGHDSSDDDVDFDTPMASPDALYEALTTQAAANREYAFMLRLARDSFKRSRRQRARRREQQLTIQNVQEEEKKDRDKAALDVEELETISKEDLLAARAARMLADRIPAAVCQTSWETFQPHDPKSAMIDRLAYPLEVLIGEPEITFIGLLNNAKRGPESRKPGPRSLPLKSITDKKPVGETPLPERILIHSKELLDVLTEINEGSWISGLPVSFLRPFKIFDYYENQIRDHTEKLAAKFSHPENDLPSTGNSGIIVKDTASAATLLHIQCLLDFLDNTIGARKKYLRSPDCKSITFSDIWYVFQPGEEVIDQDNKQVYRVLRVTIPKHNVISPFTWLRKATSEEAEEKPVTIHCVYIDFDGEKLGPMTKSFSIPRFDQEKPLKSLPICPLRMAQDSDDRSRLVDRGKMLWDVIKVKPMYYNGYTIDTREEADSQVMIDFNEALAYAREHGMVWKPKVELISTSTEENKAEESITRCEATCCIGQRVYDDSFIENKQTEDFVKSLLPQTMGERPSLIMYPRTLREMVESNTAPNTDELVLMSYRVFGFILRSRKWAQLDLTYLKYENEANKNSVISAFDRLVLPEGHKEMVKSLVSQHFRDKKARNKNTDKKMRTDAKADIIRGKGQGLIILLHGAPGVGKTTTAEGVAETFQKPLFQVTSGDLGTTASDVQNELEKNFTLASRWDCILLLDEAEVFLASRERKDFKRNGLVAVFLRVLEYYTGILFLTTNRVGDFDEAFASRIHMSLHYPKLDLKKTLRVFEVNIQLIKERFELERRAIFLDDTSILEFAKRHFNDNNAGDKRGLQWNGRQIRNACQTALAMAEYDALKGNLSDDVEPSPSVHLKLEHFNIIEKAYDEFAVYLGDVYGMDLDERAAEAKVRAEELTVAEAKSHADELTAAKPKKKRGFDRIAARMRDSVPSG
ncbi:hypothetical protein F5Y14DRAFT_436945 [Nemania sp. NC0429]|nr:hypothetical protein F5Y14DRAFT_436945 [Nemania sp. NC0429]